MTSLARPKVVVYGAWCLCHPDRGIYYAGQTTHGVVSRWNVHLWNARTSEAKSYRSRLSNWIRKHGPENIVFSELEICTVDDLDEREVAWISYLRSLGQAQANLLDGGKQPRGHKRPAHAKDMSGSNNPMYGRDRSELMAYARSFQGPASEETRVRMSEAHRGSRNARAVLDEEAIKELRKQPKRYGLFSEWARRYGVSAQTIYLAYNRKTWMHVE